MKAIRVLLIVVALGGIVAIGVAVAEKATKDDSGSGTAAAGQSGSCGSCCDKMTPVATTGCPASKGCCADKAGATVEISTEKSSCSAACAEGCAEKCAGKCSEKTTPVSTEKAAGCPASKGCCADKAGATVEISTEKSACSAACAGSCPASEQEGPADVLTAVNP